MLTRTMRLHSYKKRKTSRFKHPELSNRHTTKLLGYLNVQPHCEPRKQQIIHTRGKSFQNKKERSVGIGCKV